MNERMINMFSAKGESFVKGQIDATKKILRGRCREIRENLSEDYIEESSRAILAQVLASEEYRSAEVILAYSSMQGEVLTGSLIEQALADGKTVCLPRCLPDHQMDAKRYTAGCAMERNAYGIEEPAADAETIPPERISLIIVPCVACDARGNRLGHGAGYYDRYLARTSGTDCFRMALCFDKLILGSIRTYRDDVPMHAVVTETKIYRP